MSNDMKVTLRRFSYLVRTYPEFWHLLLKQLVFETQRALPTLPAGWTVRQNEVAATRPWFSPSYRDQPRCHTHNLSIFLHQKLRTWEPINYLLFGNSVFFNFINNNILLGCGRLLSTTSSFQVWIFATLTLWK